MEAAVGYRLEGDGETWKVDVVSDSWGSAPNPRIMSMVQVQGMSKVRFVVRRE